MSSREPYWRWCFGLYDTFEKAERARRFQEKGSDGRRLWRVCYRVAPRTKYPEQPWALIGFPYYMTEEAAKWDRSRPSS